MSHNLATTNGRTAAAYCGEVPWHKLGTKLNGPATASEAISAAGLNYEIKLSDLVTRLGHEVPRRKAVVRSDSQDVIGLVSDRYVPIQNRECFGFLDAVVADGNLRYHTAGALGKGERIWLLAKLPSTIRVKNSNDIVDKFLLLSNTHDGSSALRVFFTPIRVVCQNTFNIAEHQGRGTGISIPHKGNLTQKIREAQRVLGLAERFYDDVGAKIDLLASFHPHQFQLQKFFSTLYPDPVKGDSSRAIRIREKLAELFENGVGQSIPQVRHTMWAALNAVTEYVDHHRKTRAANSAQRASRRLQSAWFGSGNRIKANAWNAAINLLAN